MESYQHHVSMRHKALITPNPVPNTGVQEASSRTSCRALQVIGGNYVARKGHGHLLRSGVSSKPATTFQVPANPSLAAVMSRFCQSQALLSISQIFRDGSFGPSLQGVSPDLRNREGPGLTQRVGLQPSRKMPSTRSRMRTRCRPLRRLKESLTATSSTSCQEWHRIAWPHRLSGSILGRQGARVEHPDDCSAQHLEVAPHLGSGLY